MARVLPIIERTTKPEKKFHTKLQIIHLHLFLGGRGCKKLGKMVDLLLVCEMGSKKERQTSGILRGSCPRLGDILTGQILNGQRSSARNRCRPSVNMDKHKIVYLQRFGICLPTCGTHIHCLCTTCQKTGSCEEVVVVLKLLSHPRPRLVVPWCRKYLST